MMFIVQLTRRVSSHYNCTSPWFLYFARLRYFIIRKIILIFVGCCRSQGSSVPVCDPEYSDQVSLAYYDSRYRSYHQCQDPCTMMGVNTLFTFKSSTEGQQQIKFTFIREIQVTEEKLKVEIETVIANIGGYLGMLLGTSALVSDHTQSFKSRLSGVSLMDLERLVLAVFVLFSRKVGSEDHNEVDKRCEKIARLIQKTQFTSEKSRHVQTFPRCELLLNPSLTVEC